jgi:hypothetical protein
MPDACEGATAAGGDREQAALLGILHDGWVDQGRQQPPLERLRNRHQVDGFQHRLWYRSHLRFDQLDQRRRHHRCARPCPGASGVHQPSRRGFLRDQMPQIEDVSTGRLPHSPGALGIDAAGESTTQQRFRFDARQGCSSSSGR